MVRSVIAASPSKDSVPSSSSGNKSKGRGRSTSCVKTFFKRSFVSGPNENPFITVMRCNTNSISGTLDTIFFFFSAGCCRIIKFIGKLIRVPDGDSDEQIHTRKGRLQRLQQTLLLG